LYRLSSFDLGESGRDAIAKRPSFQFNFRQDVYPKPRQPSVVLRKSTCAFKGSSQETRARYAAPKPFLQRLSPTPCMSILRFKDISATGAVPSNPWLCFGRRRFNPWCKPDTGTRGRSECGCQSVSGPMSIFRALLGQPMALPLHCRQRNGDFGT
jgi:hypothetical protein